MTTVRPITKFSELDPGMLYSMFSHMTPAEAAAAYAARYGAEPPLVLTYGNWIYIPRRPWAGTTPPMDAGWKAAA